MVVIVKISDNRRAIGLINAVKHGYDIRTDTYRLFHIRQQSYYVISLFAGTKG